MAKAQLPPQKKGAVLPDVMGATVVSVGRPAV
jgi:hypothetical protein